MKLIGRLAVWLLIALGAAWFIAFMVLGADCYG